MKRTNFKIVSAHYFIFVFISSSRKFLYRHEVRKKVREYILCHFLEIIASNEEMLTLPCDELLDIINDDALNTKDEAPIWEFYLKWIRFDEENRLQNLPLILRSIRLGLLEKNVNFVTILQFYQTQIKCVNVLCSISNRKC